MHTSYGDMDVAIPKDHNGFYEPLFHMHELYDINISGSNVESALGYNQSNADDLLRQIYEKLPSSEAVVGKMD